MNEKCFGLKRSRECSVLENEVCCGYYAECPFYKPKWQFERDQKKAYKRIGEKPYEEQVQISQKYYKGKMPWLGEDV